MIEKTTGMIWIVVQVIIGYHLFFPIVLLLFNQVFGKKVHQKPKESKQANFAIIVTAYEETFLLPAVVKSILEQSYTNFTVYLVADKCDITHLIFDDSRVIVLKPEKTIASNTGSHHYAFNHFIKKHDYVTIVDSDNILKPNYLSELLNSLSLGFKAVQGLREAKNLDTTVACLDAARDIYYHYYDGEQLFKSGSSATLAGSGMAFEADLYNQFLIENKVSGAGFDKVLQNWLVKQDIRIAFNSKAIVFDEKTSQSDQLIKQRSRWINTWFKYFSYGFGLILKGIKNFSVNQLIFGLVLLRPPLFIFLLLSLIAMIINYVLGLNYVIWLLGFASFIIGFLLALFNSKTDQKIYHSLIGIPKFMFYQVISLTKIKRANQISAATKHQKNNQ
jgi:cellulose synthase/poly-beta-1,6-N-acetylglucosamine synthase-like glycosyltransferase